MTNAKKKTKVFIAGSRRLSRLNPDARRRIDNVLQKGFTIVLGDANGVDKAVQQYLHTKHYANVLVFCMEHHCRNNVGHWPIREIKAADSRRRDFEYYSTKDRCMGTEADYGLMFWDGESRGTLTNVVHLIRQGKPVVLYTAPDKSFHTLRDRSDLYRALSHFDPIALHQIDSDLRAAEMNGSRHPSHTASLF